MRCCLVQWLIVRLLGVLDGFNCGRNEWWMYCYVLMAGKWKVNWLERDPANQVK